jgi:hypothetical protein
LTVSGILPTTRKAVGIMYSGSDLASSVRSSLGAATASLVGTTYATSRLSPDPGESSRATTTASRTRGCVVSAALISPSSMR